MTNAFEPYNIKPSTRGNQSLTMPAMNKKTPTYHTSFDELLTSGQLPIADNWQPSHQCLTAISALGISLYEIKTTLRSEFILSCQAKGLTNQDWNALFLSYAKQRLAPSSSSGRNPTASQFAATPSNSPLMTDDWQPSKAMLEYILTMVCPNRDYIRAQLISFTSHYHGKSHPNWDQQFKKWINQGWNIYQNKDHFEKKDSRDFVEKHTDKSWRDGL